MTSLGFLGILSRFLPVTKSYLGLSKINIFSPLYFFRRRGVKTLPTNPFPPVIIIISVSEYIIHRRIKKVLKIIAFLVIWLLFFSSSGSQKINIDLSNTGSIIRELVVVPLTRGPVNYT